MSAYVIGNALLGPIALIDLGERQVEIGVMQELDPNFGEAIDPRAFFFMLSGIEVALL